MKKLLIAFFVIIILAVAWYLISPLWRVVERDDASPLINDALETMTKEEREAFDMAVQEAPVMPPMDEPMQPTVSLLAQGEFKPRAHEVEGTALLIQDGDQKILRFEDFETVNGPNLNIYLATDASATDYIDLGDIRATKGNVNYEIDASIDTDKYDTVLVWCVPFRVLFSYAELQ